MLDRIVCDQDPEGNLRFRFGNFELAWLHKESLALRELRFRPGGGVLISLQQICWTIVPGGLYPYLWDSENAKIEIESSDGEEARLRIEARSADRRLLNQSEVSIRYAAGKDRFVYRVKQMLKVLREYR
jgi:hypothetical protein